MDFLAQVPKSNSKYQEGEKTKGKVFESNEEYNRFRADKLDWKSKVPLSEESNEGQEMLDDWDEMLKFQNDFPFPTLESIFKGKGTYIETVFTARHKSQMFIDEKIAYPLDPFDYNFPATPNITKRHVLGTLIYTKLMDRFNRKLFSKESLGQALSEIWMDTKGLVDNVDLVRIGIGDKMPNGLNRGISVAFVEDKLWDDYFAGGLHIPSDRFIIVRKSYLKSPETLKEFLAHEISHSIQGFRNKTYRNDLQEINSKEERYYVSIISEMESYLIGGSIFSQENSLDFNQFLQCFTYIPYGEFLLLQPDLKEKLQKVYSNCVFILTKCTQEEKTEFIHMINYQILTLDDLADKYKIQMNTNILFTNN